MFNTKYKSLIKQLTAQTLGKFKICKRKKNVMSAFNIFCKLKSCEKFDLNLIVCSSDLMEPLFKKNYRKENLDAHRFKKIETISILCKNIKLCQKKLSS